MNKLLATSILIFLIGSLAIAGVYFITHEKQSSSVTDRNSGNDGSSVSNSTTNNTNNNGGNIASKNSGFAINSTLNSEGSILASFYSDANCTQQIFAINWGNNCKAGETLEHTIYVKNTWKSNPNYNPAFNISTEVYWLCNSSLITCTDSQNTSWINAYNSTEEPQWNYQRTIYTGEVEAMNFYLNVTNSPSDIQIYLWDIPIGLQYVTPIGIPQT